MVFESKGLKMEESKNKDVNAPVEKEQEEIRKDMSNGFNEMARHEAMIRRMEEVKRDSIKIKLLEDMNKELKDIRMMLKSMNERMDKKEDPTNNRYV